jgi:hypothetical protein
LIPVDMLTERRLAPLLMRSSACRRTRALYMPAV